MCERVMSTRIIPLKTKRGGRATPAALTIASKEV